MRNYNINRLKHKGQLGTIEQGEDQNGMPTNVFKSQRDLWFGEYRASITQNPFVTTPVHAQNTRTVVIRHDTTVNTKQVLEINGLDYRITDIEPDDEVNGLDILTLVTYSDDSDSNTNSNNSDSDDNDNGSGQM